MSFATQVNSYRQFKYSVTYVAGVELVKMLANENHARSLGRQDLVPTQHLSNHMASYLLGRGFIEPDARPNFYRLSDAGVLVALLQSQDAQTMASVQTQQHDYVVHPDTLAYLDVTGRELEAAN